MPLSALFALPYAICHCPNNPMNAMNTINPSNPMTLVMKENQQTRPDSLFDWLGKSE
jgi:hypothetical protein